MPIKWKDVVKKPAYVNASLEERKKVQDIYFNDVVLPNVSEDQREFIQKEFYAHVSEVEPGIKKQSKSFEEGVDYVINPDGSIRIKQQPGFGEYVTQGLNLITGGIPKAIGNLMEASGETPKEKPKQPKEKGFIDEAKEGLWQAANVMTGGLPQAASNVIDYMQGPSEEELVQREREKKLKVARKLRDTRTVTKLLKEGEGIEETFTHPAYVGATLALGGALEPIVGVGPSAFARGLRLLGREVGEDLTFGASGIIRNIGKKMIKDPEIKKALIDKAEREYRGMFEIDKMSTVNPRSGAYNIPAHSSGRLEDFVDEMKIVKSLEKGEIEPLMPHNMKAYEGVLEKQLTKLKTDKTLTNLPVGKGTRGVFKNTIYWMEELGKPIKRLLLDQDHKIRRIINQENGINKRMIKLFEDELPKEAAERIELYSIAQQGARGEAVLKKMGKLPDWKDLTYKEFLEGTGRKVPTWDELTPGEQAFYNWRRGKYEETYKRLNETRKALGKKELGYVENYSTFFRHMEEVEAQGINPYTADKGILLSNYDPFFTKTRGKQTQKLKLNAFENTDQYLKSAVKYEHTAPMVQTFHNAIKKSGIKDTKPVLGNSLDVWTKGLSGSKMQSGLVKNIDDLYEHARTLPYVGKLLPKTPLQNVATSLILYKLPTVASQFLNIVPTMATEGVGNTLGAIRSVLFSDAARKKIMEDSVMWWARRYEDINASTKGAISFEQFINNPVQAMQRAGKRFQRHPAETSKDLGMFLIDFTDNLSSKITYEAARKNGMKRGLRGPALEEYADDQLLRIQGSATPGDKTFAQMTDIGAKATMLGNFVIANWNLLTREMTKTTKFPLGDRRALAKIATTMIGMTTINSATDAIGIRSLLPDPIKAFNEEYNKDIEKQIGSKKLKTKKREIAPALAEAGKELFTGYFPLAGSLKYGGGLTGPGIEAITRAARGTLGSDYLDVSDITSLYGVPKNMIKLFSSDRTASDLLLGLEPKEDTELVKKLKKNLKVR